MKKPSLALLSYSGLIFPLVLLLSFLSLTTFHLFTWVAYIAFATFLVALCTLFSSKINRFLFVLSSVIYTVILTIETLLAYVFQTTLTKNMAFIFFETNPKESHDFLETYLTPGTLSIIVSIIVFALLGLYFFFKTKPYLFVTRKWISVLLIFGSLGVIGVGHRHFLPTLFVESQQYYKKNIAEYINVYADKMGGDFSDISCSTDSLLGIVIIGESDSRPHHSLYGYPRNTNPLLGEEARLLAFSQVISPNCATISSLTKVLTLGSRLHPEKNMDGSLMQLTNRAGFTSYWISNQAAIGTYDNEITRMAESCQHIYFTPGEKKIHYSSSKDEAVLPQFERVLKTQQAKKLIFIHLMGSHYTYSVRYPKAFDHFKDDFPKDYYGVNSAKKISTINAYDNSILYNDWLIKTIIDKVKGSQKPSFVLYFSDHGEDTYTTEKDYTGHGDYKNTDVMHEIPFMLWTSEDKGYFESLNPQDQDLKKPYCTEHLIYTLADLLKIQFKEDKPELSLFSSDTTVTSKQ